MEVEAAEGMEVGAAEGMEVKAAEGMEVEAEVLNTSNFDTSNPKRASLSLTALISST